MIYLFLSNKSKLHVQQFALVRHHAKMVIGGEGGIRTPGTVARTSHFECDAIDHSATSPEAGLLAS